MLTLVTCSIRSYITSHLSYVSVVQCGREVATSIYLRDLRCPSLSIALSQSPFILMFICSFYLLICIMF